MSQPPADFSKYTKKRPTLAQIAEAAGVSIATVSKVMNQRDDIAVATRERVERVIVEMGYVTPGTMHAFRRKKRKSMLHLVCGYLSEYEMEIMRGVSDVLRETNMRLMLSPTDEDPQEEYRWISEAIEGTAEGLLFVGNVHYIDELLEQRIPFAILDCENVFNENVPSVGATNWAGGRMATHYLLELGHRRIAMITGPTDNHVSKARVAGYKAALTEAGIPFDPGLVVPGAFVVQTGYAQTCVLLDKSEPPTAIFAGSDLQAAGVYQALYERNIPVPHGMSVIGFDDLALATTITPTLTTIRQPLREMGRIATNMVLRLVNGESLDAMRIELPTTLLVRKSCAPITRSVF